MQIHKRSHWQKNSQKDSKFLVCSNSELPSNLIPRGYRCATLYTIKHQPLISQDKTHVKGTVEELYSHLDPRNCDAIQQIVWRS